MKKKTKKLFFGLAVIAIALLFARQQTLFSIYQPGAEAPLTGEIELEIVGRELTEGAPVKALEGELVKATWNAEWFNRSYSSFGGAAVAALWYLDGEFVEMASGKTASVSAEYCVGTHPDEGCVGKEQWSWETLSYVAKLPSLGGTTAFVEDVKLSTLGLQKGMHQITVKVFMVNDSSKAIDIFQCGETNGVCCPLQTESQGFPCPGIYGSTVLMWRTESAICGFHASMWGNTATCPTGMGCEACRDYCCIKSWCGGGWCSSTAPGNCYTLGSVTEVACDNGGRTTWGGWQQGMGEQVSKEQAVAAAKGGAVTVALAEFEVVEECKEECCVGQSGVQDMFCLQPGHVCSGGVCVREKAVCPFECCDGEEEYFDKGCAVIALHVPNGEMVTGCVGRECETKVVCDSGFELVGGKCVKSCPFECCESQEGYLDKWCGESEECVSNKCVSVAELGWIERLFKFFQSILSWFFGLFGLGG